MASVPRFDADRLATAANEIFTVRRVFGEAYERDGVTVIPVAKVWAATGMGQGDGEGGGELPHGAHVRGWWRDAQQAWRPVGQESASGEVAVVVTLVAGLDQAALQGVVAAINAALAADEVVAERVDSLELRLRRAS